MHALYIEHLDAWSNTAYLEWLKYSNWAALPASYHVHHFFWAFRHPITHEEHPLVTTQCIVDKTFQHYEQVISILLLRLFSLHYEHCISTSTYLFLPLKLFEYLPSEQADTPQLALAAISDDWGLTSATKVPLATRLAGFASSAQKLEVLLSSSSINLVYSSWLYTTLFLPPKSTGRTSGSMHLYRTFMLSSSFRYTKFNFSIDLGSRKYLTAWKDRRISDAKIRIWKIIKEIWTFFFCIKSTDRFRIFVNKIKEKVHF